MAKKITTRLGLYITTERRRDYGSYFHVRATVVVIGTTRYERARIDAGESLNVPYQRIRNVSDSDGDSPLLLQNLQVNSQGNDGDAHRKLYGWDVEYRNLYSVDRRQAEGMAKSLGAIERTMRKLDDKYGRPATFGAYLARVAEAIGADAMVFCETENARGAWSYEDVDNRVRDMREGISYVDHIVRKWERETEAANAVSA